MGVWLHCVGLNLTIYFYHKAECGVIVRLLQLKSSVKWIKDLSIPKIKGCARRKLTQCVLPLCLILSGITSVFVNIKMYTPNLQSFCLQQYPTRNQNITDQGLCTAQLYHNPVCISLGVRRLFFNAWTGWLSIGSQLLLKGPPASALWMSSFNDPGYNYLAPTFFSFCG